jgi:MurNAc alpha-1-phosphate uridylyltransferase
MPAPIDTAMVLAAGLGERMRPLTEQRPKPLVTLAGRALVDHVLDRLAAAGITRAVVNLHYLADQLETHLAARAGRPPHIVLSDERARLLDTGGGVVAALPLLAGDNFVIANSDTVWLEADEGADPRGHTIARLVQAFDAERMDCLLLLAPSEGSLGYGGQGDFDLAAEGRLSARREGDRAQHVFAGVSIAHRRLFRGATAEPFSLARLWHRALAEGRAFGLEQRGRWMHVGDPGALAEAEAVLAGHEGTLR